MTIYTILPIALFAIFADAASTVIALRKGAQESNPTMQDARGFWAFVAPIVKPFLLYVGVMIALRIQVQIPWVNESYISMLVVALALALGKIHASLENLSLAYLDFSPSNSLRHLLKLRAGLSHAVFNGVYFGLPWAIAVVHSGVVEA